MRHLPHQLVGWDDGAYRASNDTDVSIVPPKIPYGGFSLGTAPKLACQTGPSLITRRLSLLPACPSRDQVCLHPSCSPRQHGSPRSVSEATCSVEHRHASDVSRSTPGAIAPVRVMLS